MSDPGADPATQVPAVPPQGIPLPIVGMPVQYYTTLEHRVVERMGSGPYAATITEVISPEKGIVCLFVRPPMSPGYDVANVQYGPLGEDNEDGWVLATFY